MKYLKADGVGRPKETWFWKKILYKIHKVLNNRC